MSILRLRRRQMIVDSFQYRLIAVGMVHFAIVVLVFAAAVFLPLTLDLHTELSNSPLAQSAARQLAILHRHVWIPLLLTFVLLTLHILLVSHRIAGPLYRIRKRVNGIGLGDVCQPIKLRDKDYLFKEATALNDMMESVNSKLCGVDSGLRDSENALRELRVALDNDSREAVERALKILTENVDSTREALSEFTFTHGREHRGEGPIRSRVSRQATARTALPVAQS